jgi:hypothetical protein
LFLAGPSPGFGGPGAAYKMGPYALFKIEKLYYIIMLCLTMFKKLSNIHFKIANI